MNPKQIPLPLVDSESHGNVLRDHGVYLFTEDVNAESVKPVIEFILEENLNQDSKLDHLTLIINSPGGYVCDGFSLIDVMMGSKIPIHTVGLGMIASMGLLIFLAGEKGYRTLTPNTSILSHQFSGGDYGKEHELIAGRKGFDHTSEIMIKHYRRTTGLSLTDIRKYLLPPEDIWLSAIEAKKLGVCDIVKDLKPRELQKPVLKKKKKK